MVNHCLVKFSGHKYCGSGGLIVLDFARPRDEINMFLYGWEPCKFGGQWHCRSEDIIVLVCLVILQNHVTKGSGSFMGSSPSS